MDPAWKFYRHMPVYLKSGRLLGRSVEVGHAADYLHVQQGRLLVTDWYVPAGAINKVTANGVFLSVTAADLRGHRWNVPPDEYLRRQGATPGYEYTSGEESRSTEGQSHP